MSSYTISSVSDEKISFEKISCSNNIENILNDNFNINNYSNISGLFLVYVITNPNSIPRPDKLSYLRKSKTLQIVYNLNYETFVIAQQEQATKLMAEAYLQAIEKYLIDRKDFNGKKFYDDAKQLFINNGIL